MEDMTAIDLSSVKARQMTAYQGLAKRACDLGEGWLALNAQSAAVWLGAQFTLVKFARKNESALDIENSLNELWEKAQEETAAVVPADGAEISLDLVLAVSYKIIRDSLNARAKKYFDSIVTPAELFADVTVSKDSMNSHFAWETLGPASTDILVSRKLYDAKKLYKEFYMLREESRTAAYAALYQADMLSFEAWLLQRSKDIKDDSRAFVGIQLALANAYLQQLPGIPTAPVVYEEHVRGSFARTLGLDDALDFATILPSIHV